MVSSKVNNYDYAPGIATYGVEGKQGETGIPGTSLFYTSFDIYNEASEVMKMGTMMKQQFLPISNTTQKINRPYMNGDCVFDSIGNIYIITDIDGLCGGNNGAYSRFMKLCGKIQQTEGNDYFNMNSGGRLKINSQYTGLDIVRSDGDINYDSASDYTIRLISDKVNDSNIEFIRFNAVYGQNLNDTLDIYYDTTMNAYHITSNGPIFIDAELLVSDDNSSAASQYDGYSPALCSETPITKFKNLCGNLSVKFSPTAEDKGKIGGVTLVTPENPGIAFENALKDLQGSNKAMVKIVFNAVSDGGGANGVYTWVYKFADNFGDEFISYVDGLNADVDILTVSLINRIEIYIDFDDSEME